MIYLHFCVSQLTNGSSGLNSICIHVCLYISVYQFGWQNKCIYLSHNIYTNRTTHRPRPWLLLFTEATTEAVAHSAHSQLACRPSPIFICILWFRLFAIKHKKQTKVHRNWSIVIDCNLVNIHYQFADLHLNARVIQLHAKFRQRSTDLPVAKFCLFMCLLTLFSFVFIFLRFNILIIAVRCIASA